MNLELEKQNAKVELGEECLAQQINKNNNKCIGGGEEILKLDVGRSSCEEGTFEKDTPGKDTGIDVFDVELPTACSSSGSGQSNCGTWDQMYQRLLNFHQKHGHCRVPNRCHEDSQLGAWVSTQRRFYKLMKTGRRKKSALTPEREKLLTDLGFEWSLEKPGWVTSFIELLEFVVKYGHSEVPTKWKDFESLHLSNWVSNQRREYQNMQLGRHSNLTDMRIRLLNSIGFVWHAQRGGVKRLRDGQCIAASDKKNLTSKSECASDSYRTMAERLVRALSKDNDEQAALRILGRLMIEENLKLNEVRKKNDNTKVAMKYNNAKKQVSEDIAMHKYSVSQLDKDEYTKTTPATAEQKINRLRFTGVSYIPGQQISCIPEYISEQLYPFFFSSTIKERKKQLVRQYLSQVSVGLKNTTNLPNGRSTPLGMPTNGPSFACLPHLTYLDNTCELPCNNTSLVYLNTDLPISLKNCTPLSTAHHQYNYNQDFAHYQDAVQYEFLQRMKRRKIQF